MLYPSPSPLNFRPMLCFAKLGRVYDYAPGVWVVVVQCWEWVHLKCDVALGGRVRR